jgi:DNA-binding NtrC family response regulator
MRARTVTDRTGHRIDGRLQAKLDALARDLVTDVLAAARRSLEEADGDGSVRANQHGVRKLRAPQHPGAYYQLTQGGQLQGYRQLRKQVLRHFETDYLMAALQAASGSISAAARIARVDRKHLWRLIQRTGVRYVP